MASEGFERVKRFGGTDTMRRVELEGVGRIGRGRVFCRPLFRSTSQEATNCAHHEDFFHHGARAEVNYFVHRPAMILK
jgi:hypothetical protein